MFSCALQSLRERWRPGSDLETSKLRENKAQSPWSPQNLEKTRLRVPRAPQLNKTQVNFKKGFNKRVQSGCSNLQGSKRPAQAPQTTCMYARVDTSIYIYIYIYNVHMHIHIHMHTHPRYTHTRYTFIIYIYICIQINIRIHDIHVHMHINIHKHYIYIYIYIYIYMLYIYIYIYIYIYAYT